MFRKVLRRQMLVAACLTMLVAGCGNDAGGADDASMLGALGFGSPADTAAFQARAAAREQDLIVACMRDAGFRYVAMLGGAAPAGPGLVDPTDRADAEEHGFRLATTGSRPEPSTVDDPNRAIVLSLSPAQQDAYNQALDDLQSDGTTGPDGCRQRAHETVYGSVERAAAQLEGPMTDLRRRLESDPAYVALTNQWAGCIKQHGYSYATREDLQRDVIGRYAKTGARAAAPGRPGIPTAASTGPDSVALAAAADFERAVAVAYVECQEPIREPEEALFRRYFREMADDNQAAITQLRQAVSAS